MKKYLAPEIEIEMPIDDLIRTSTSYDESNGDYIGEWEWEDYNE